MSLPSCRVRGAGTDIAAPNTLAPSHWDRFDPAGRFVGAARVPAGFVAAAVHGTQAVTGVLKDDLGVEYVVRYSVR
jgi:hypothetical protein